MAGVSRAAITSKIANGTLIINSAGKLDTDNPVNRTYLDRKQQNLRSGSVNLSEKHETRKNQTARENTSGLPAEMMTMTIRELIERNGDIAGIERFTKILRDLTSADEKALRIQERRQLLIPKDFVVSRLFGYANQLSGKILDVPESMVDQVIALVKASPDNCRRKLIEYIRDMLSHCIGGAKENILNELASFRNKAVDTGLLQQEQLEEIYEHAVL